MKNFPRKTGLWLRDDVPHTGWRCIEIKDGNTICGMWEVARVIYVHLMQHDNYPDWLSVGCDCAGHMTEDPAVEQLRELLYKWRKTTQRQRTPLEKLRRKSWKRDVVRWNHGRDYSFAWSTSLDGDRWNKLFVQIQNANDGWRYQLMMNWIELVVSEPFPADVEAATAGIERAEMMLADPNEAARIKQDNAEARAWNKAAEEAGTINYVVDKARENGREDLAQTVVHGTMPVRDVMYQLHDADDKRRAIERARENGREDLAQAIASDGISMHEAWMQLGALEAKRRAAATTREVV